MTPLSDENEGPGGVVALLLDDLAPPRLGTLLRAARKRGSRTRREVAARVGTTAGELRRYERGDAPVPARVIAALAECYGADLTSQFATRIPIEVDAGRVAVGTEASDLESANDNEVLETYARLVQRVRHSQPGQPIGLRADDLVALSRAVGHDIQHVESRIVDLLGCTPREARSLHAEMLRRKLVVPMAGLVTGLAVIGGVGVAAAASGTTATHEEPAPAQVSVAAAQVAVAPTTAPPTTAPPRTAPPATVAPDITWPAADTPDLTAATTPEAATHPADPPAAPETPTTAAPAPTEPAPAEPAAHPASLPRPVITPDSTPMSIPANETVTIIQP